MTVGRNTIMKLHKEEGYLAFRAVVCNKGGYIA